MEIVRKFPTEREICVSREAVSSTNHSLSERNLVCYGQFLWEAVHISLQRSEDLWLCSWERALHTEDLDFTPCQLHLKRKTGKRALSLEKLLSNMANYTRLDRVAQCGFFKAHTATIYFYASQEQAFLRTGNAQTPLKWSECCKHFCPSSYPLYSSTFYSPSR